MPIIGAHVSAAVSLELSFDKALEIGAEATQIFISPPQMWKQSEHPQDEIKAYLEKQKESGIGPNFIHGAYLINLATDNSYNLKQAIDWLAYSLNEAAQLGINGTIFHIGSCKDRAQDICIKQVIESISQILAKSNKANLILENCAGAGNLIGDQLSELGEIIKRVGDPRVKVCLDTQHLFASGYDVKTKKGLDDILEEFDREVGLENLVVIHCNDSKTEQGSKKDRHENIGEGFIGREAFSNWLNHPKLQNVPFILEVPGITGNGPDKENINLLKSLITNNYPSYNLNVH